MRLAPRTGRPADWKDQLNRWNRYHYARVTVIIAAFALLYRRPHLSPPRAGTALIPGR